MNFMKFLFISLFLMNTWNVEGQEQFRSNFIALDPAVRYGKLDNGFTYYLRRNDVPPNSVVLYLIVKAGVYHQDEDQLEYAHLLEHLVSKETDHLPDLKSFFQSAGRYSNAKTGMDNTTYYAIIPSDDKQKINTGLQIVRHWAQGISWDSSSVKVERAAVLGEMRTNDPYRTWVRRTIEEHIMKNSGLTPNDPEKNKMNVQNFELEALNRFHKDWYRPGLEAAIIVGDINVDSVELQIRRLFSDLKTPEHPKNAQHRVDAQTLDLKGGNSFITVLDSLHPDFRVEVIRKRPNFMYNPKTKNDYRKMLLQQLYGILMEVRAKQLEQQYNPPFSDFSPNYRSNILGGRQINATQMTIELKAVDSHQTRRQFIRGLTAWKRMHNGFTDAALDKAKEQIQQNYSYSDFLTSFSLAQRYRQHYINGTAAPDPMVESKLVSRILETIDLSDIKDYTRNYGTFTKNTDFIFFKGKRQNIPDYNAFRQWIKEVDAMDVQPMESPRAPISSLADVVSIPVPDITEDVDIAENVIGVSTVMLKGGIKVVLKPTKPNSESFANTVTIHGFRPNRIPVDNRKEYLAAKVAPEVMKYTGAGPYNKFELKRFMHDKGIKLRFKTNKDSQLIYGECKITSLQELINLLYLYLNNPRRDLNGFSAWKTYKKEQLQGNGLRGSTEFIMDKFFSVWYPEIPVLEIQDLQELSLQEVHQAWNQWFSDVHNFTFIVTGDFNKNDVLPILVNNLSGFPVREQPLTDTPINPRFPLERMDETIYFHNIDQVYARLYFPVSVPRDLKTQIELRLLSRALNDRIYDRLREGCYAPTAGGEWVDIKNEIYAFRIYFDSALGNENIMLNYAIDEFRRLRDNGVDKKWLETAIANELNVYEGRFASFGYFNFWPDYLQLKLENGEDPVTGILSYGTILEHFISLKDINAAAKKYLSEENLQQFLGYPEGYQK